MKRRWVNYDHTWNSVLLQHSSSLSNAISLEQRRRENKRDIKYTFGKCSLVLCLGKRMDGVFLSIFG
jgi:hypothetical protein